MDFITHQEPPMFTVYRIQFFNFDGGIDGMGCVLVSQDQRPQLLNVNGFETFKDRLAHRLAQFGGGVGPEGLVGPEELSTLIRKVIDVKDLKDLPWPMLETLIQELPSKMMLYLFHSILRSLQALIIEGDWEEVEQVNFLWNGCIRNMADKFNKDDVELMQRMSQSVIQFVAARLSSNT